MFPEPGGHLILLAWRVVCSSCAGLCEASAWAPSPRLKDAMDGIQTTAIKATLMEGLHQLRGFSCAKCAVSTSYGIIIYLGTLNFILPGKKSHPEATDMPRASFCLSTPNTLERVSPKTLKISKAQSLLLDQ